MQGTAPDQKSLFIDTGGVQKATSLYRAINHSLRLQIIELIHKAGTKNVTPIIRNFNLEQSLISAHLKILRDAGILNYERKGRSIYYSINYSEINRISTITEKLVPCKTGTPRFLKNGDHTLVVRSKEDKVSFTSTELKIIHLICTENTSDEIAEKLGINKRAVEEYQSMIIKKMKVRNSVGILFFAIKNGLFEI